MRLSKLMSERGVASRREADEWIEQGWVRVNGEVVDELGTRVFPDVSITIDPLARTQQAQRVTILPTSRLAICQRSGRRRLRARRDPDSP